MSEVDSRLAPVLDALSSHKEALRARWVRGPASAFAFEFLSFGVKQAWACLFGALFLAALIVTHFIYPEWMPLYRYDFLLLFAVAVQALLLWLRLETWAEAKVILIFHVVGTAMEIFKTAQGSWIYPEASVMHISGVPLFTGFMYGCVGSYIARIWRIMDFRFEHYPSPPLTFALAAAIYVNFFAHHYVADARWLLLAILLVLHVRTMTVFRVDLRLRRMPTAIGFFLVALFIWIGENIGTYTRTWMYPDQQQGWHMVSLSKLSAWYLLMYISFVLVTLVHKPVGLGSEQNRNLA